MIAPLPGVTICKPASGNDCAARHFGKDRRRRRQRTEARDRRRRARHRLSRAGSAVAVDAARIWGDRNDKETYWSRFADRGWYFAGDGARYGRTARSGCWAASTT